jgi:hypothetical protein
MARKIAEKVPTIFKKSWADLSNALAEQGITRGYFLSMSFNSRLLYASKQISGKTNGIFLFDVFCFVSLDVPVSTFNHSGGGQHPSDPNPVEYSR